MSPSLFFVIAFLSVVSVALACDSVVASTVIPNNFCVFRTGQKIASESVDECTWINTSFGLCKVIFPYLRRLASFYIDASWTIHR